MSLRCEYLKKAFKPAKNRLFVKRVDETGRIFQVRNDNQYWRAKVLAVGEGVDFVQVDDYIRMQCMKQRFDTFSIDGEEIVSLDKDWLYLVETSDGSVVMVFGSKLVLEMQSDRWGWMDRWRQGKTFIIGAGTAFDVAKVIAVGEQLRSEVDFGDTVLVAKNNFWQFYRVNGGWRFVSDISNVLAVIGD